MTKEIASVLKSSSMVSGKINLHILTLALVKRGRSGAMLAGPISKKRKINPEDMAQYEFEARQENDVRAEIENLKAALANESAMLVIVS